MQRYLQDVDLCLAEIRMWRLSAIQIQSKVADRQEHRDLFMQTFVEEDIQKRRRQSLPRKSTDFSIALTTHLSHRQCVTPRRGSSCSEVGSRPTWIENGNGRPVAASARSRSICCASWSPNTSINCTQR